MEQREMIENGMIVGAERYDPQCQDTECRDCECSRCSCCSQWVPDNELTAFSNGDRVCVDCLHDYLEKQGADFVPGYIAQNEAEFWLDWLFANADPDEQLRVVKAGYLAEGLKPLQKEYIEQQKVDFCQDDANFLEYVRGELL